MGFLVASYFKFWAFCCDILGSGIILGTHSKTPNNRLYSSEFWPINPLLPSAANMRRSAKTLILILEGIIKKNSYERRDYESVDEKSLS